MIGTRARDGNTASKETRPAGLKDIFLSWFIGPAKLSDPREINAPYGAENPAGKEVTVATALQLSAAWSCIKLLSETIASLPCQLYERGSNNERRGANKHPLYELLHNQPHADMTAMSFWQAYVASMLTHGAGYAEKHYSQRRLVALEPLHPGRIGAKVLASGALEWRYVDLDGEERTIPENKLFYTPAFSLNGRTGLSPIRYGASVLGAALAADESSGKIFANGMRPLGALSIDKILTPKQREDMRANVLDKFRGSTNNGAALLLEAGMKYETFSIPPEDAQLLATRSFGIEEVCRWFGVPPIMVGHSEKVTAWGTGIEQIVIGFLTFSLRPWLTRLEQSIRRQLIEPEERARYFAEFSVEGLLRSDSAARASFYSTMAQNGLMSRNEIRRLENLPPIDGGDVLTVQSNLIAIDKLSEEPSDAPPVDEQLRSALGRLLHAR
jgi:HK97 family phage portal protein